MSFLRGLQRIGESVASPPQSATLATKQHASNGDSVPQHSADTTAAPVNGSNNHSTPFPWPWYFGLPAIIGATRMQHIIGATLYLMQTSAVAGYSSATQRELFVACAEMILRVHAMLVTCLLHASADVHTYTWVDTMALFVLLSHEHDGAQLQLQPLEKERLGVTHVNAAAFYPAGEDEPPQPPEQPPRPLSVATTVAFQHVLSVPVTQELVGVLLSKTSVRDAIMQAAHLVPAFAHDLITARPTTHNSGGNGDGSLFLLIFVDALYRACVLVLQQQMLPDTGSSSGY